MDVKALWHGGAVARRNDGTKETMNEDGDWKSWETGDRKIEEMVDWEKEGPGKREN